MSSRRSSLFIAMAATVAFLAFGASQAAALVIDDFSTNQAALTLTYGPAGTTASSSVSGPGILGGERDMQLSLTAGVIAGNTDSEVVSSGFLSYSQDATIQGSGIVSWDGTDGSPAINTTGLGGVDLTAGGTQSEFDLGVFFDDLPIVITLTVVTDPTHASAAVVSLPGLIFAATPEVIPFSSFVPVAAFGADFTNVGAIAMGYGSAVTAPDLVIDSLTTGPVAVATTLTAAPTTSPDYKLSATLKAGDTPVDGETITFTAGGTVLCSAVTNGSGVASCSATKKAQQNAIKTAGKYKATFAGDPPYTPSSATAPFVAPGKKKK